MKKKYESRKNKVKIKKDASFIASCAQLAMLLEVSAHPKPGNIDRDDDYKDTTFEHFITSAVSVYPIIESAAASNKKIGKFIRKAVINSNNWQNGGNTHFGAFLLILPLSMAAGKIIRKRKKITIDALIEEAKKIVTKSNVKDAVQLYKSFKPAGVKVRQIDDFDLANPDAINDIKKNRKTLFELMEISSTYDIIAREWTCGFEQCTTCSKIIIEQMNAKTTKLHIKGSKINNAIVYTFLKMLSMNKDTFIETKYDTKIANEILQQAQKIIDKIELDSDIDIIKDIQAFDKDLLERSINPGSTADIIVGGLFIALFGGMKF